MATQPELVEQLFEAALALKPEEREAFLEHGCGHDEELRRTVEALLVEDANAGSLLEHPPFALMSQAVLSPGSTAPLLRTMKFFLPPPGAVQAGRNIARSFRDYPLHR